MGRARAVSVPLLPVSLQCLARSSAPRRAGWGVGAPLLQLRPAPPRLRTCCLRALAGIRVGARGAANCRRSVRRAARGLIRLTPCGARGLRLPGERGVGGGRGTGTVIMAWRQRR